LSKTYYSIKKLCDIVKEAGQILLGDGRTHISSKGYADYVTEADLAVQEFIISRLGKMYPDAEFLSEEKEYRPDPAKHVFVLDPVDGTTNLIRRLNQSSISLGLVIEGKPVMGIVYNPFVNEMFYAERGNGAFLNGRKISVSSAKKLSDSLAVVGTSPVRRDNAKENMRMIAKVFDACQDIRCFGSGTLNICSVADGRHELYVEADIKPWDFCAGSVIISEAGGKLTDWNGNTPYPFKNLNVIATNGEVHNEAVALVSDIDLK